MAETTKTDEDRIREYAYYLWETEGRPVGRADEFWHRASEQIANDRVLCTPAKRKQRARATQAAPKARSRNRTGSSRITSADVAPFAP